MFLFSLSNMLHLLWQKLSVRHIRLMLHMSDNVVTKVCTNGVLVGLGDRWELNHLAFKCTSIVKLSSAALFSIQDEQIVAQRWKWSRTNHQIIKYGWTYFRALCCRFWCCWQKNQTSSDHSNSLRALRTTMTHRAGSWISAKESFLWQNEQK